jgi:hypothetical protein
MQSKIPMKKDNENFGRSHLATKPSRKATQEQGPEGFLPGGATSPYKI